MPTAPRSDIFCQRYYRSQWHVEDGVPTQGIQHFENRMGKTKQNHYEYPEFRTRAVSLNDCESRFHWKATECIYCRSIVCPESGPKLTEEHIIPRGIGGSLILPNASCEHCQKVINVFETNAINMMFSAVIKHSNVRTISKKLKSKVRCRLVDKEGNEQKIFLPLREHPVLLTMGQLMAPGILCGRKKDESGLGSLWSKAFRFEPSALNASGRNSGFSETFDVLYFSQLLAKIAHSYTIAEVGLSCIQPYLNSFIQSRFDSEFMSLGHYQHVGGSPYIEPPSDNLHEIGLAHLGHEYLIYSVVRIRLFANLGTPTYYVVSGHFTDLSDISYSKKRTNFT